MIEYKTARSNYKKTCRNLKNVCQNSISLRLESNFSNPKMFWRTIKQLTYIPTPDSYISNEDWLNHFKSIFQTDELIVDEIVEQNDNFDIDSNEYCILNSKIDVQEVIDAINDLNMNKAVSGELIPAHVKYGLFYLLPYIVQIFNKVLISVIFPRAWSLSIIIPIHKKVAIITLIIIGA